MKNFKQIITEERKNYNSIALLQSEITSYINKVRKILPKDIQDIIAITNKYNILSPEALDDIRFSNKSQIPSLSSIYNVPTDTMDLLRTLLKSNKKYIKLLPQYQSPTERAALEAGKLSMDDLTIDLTSNTGRNAAAKLYTPIVLKIVNQYVGKSKLDKPSLLSAGMQGLADAINDYGKNEKDGGKKTTFKTYVSYRVQQAILNEINHSGHDLSGGNWYAVNKYGSAAFDAVSLDGLTTSDNNDDFKQDRLVTPTEDKPLNPNLDKEEWYWKDVFKLIGDKFSTRDTDIFYRYFGLGPYRGKRQKSKDIAKEYNMSEGNIRNSVINKIIKFLKTNPRAHQMMQDLRDIYTESLLRDLIYMDKEVIIETLYNDHTYILLEDMTRWNNKQILIQSVNAACDHFDIEEVKFIYNCLIKGVDFLKKNIKKEKYLIIDFLSEIYPSEDMTHKSPDELVDYMNELITAGKTLKVSW